MEIEAQNWERAQQALERAVALYLDDPNVTLIDLGYCRHTARDNYAEPNLTVRVHVRQKLTSAAFTAFAAEEPGRVISAERLGFPVEVLPAIYRLQLSSRNAAAQPEHAKAYDQLCGGLSISGEWRQSFGTLGGKVCDRQTGEELLLSAWHVLSGTKKNISPGAIYQPAREHDNMPRPSIAEYRRGAMANHLDAAVAQLTSQRQLLCTQFGLGNVTGVTSPQLGMQVVKSGCGTGVTKGFITGINGHSLQRYAGISHLIRHIVQITPESADRIICAYGDSGAWWLECATRRVVAMHFAGSQQPNWAIALAMPEVLAALDVDIVTAPETTPPIVAMPIEQAPSLNAELEISSESLTSVESNVMVVDESHLESQKHLSLPLSPLVPSGEIAVQPLENLQPLQTVIAGAIDESLKDIPQPPFMPARTATPSSLLPVSISPWPAKPREAANWRLGFAVFRTKAIMLSQRLKPAAISLSKKLAALVSPSPRPAVIEEVEIEILDDDVMPPVPFNKITRRQHKPIALWREFQATIYQQQWHYAAIIALIATILIFGGFLIVFDTVESHLQEYRQNREQQLAHLQKRLQEVQSFAVFDSLRECQINRVNLIINRYNPELAGVTKYDLAREIVTLSQKYNQLEPDLICAVITVETRWNPEAVSFAGAVGLMQMLPSTARGIAEKNGLRVDSPTEILFDPIDNARLGCLYLGYLIGKYGLEAGLAGYNAGERWAAQWKKHGQAPPGLPDETRAYVPNVLKCYKTYQNTKA